MSIYLLPHGPLTPIARKFQAVFLRQPASLGYIGQQGMDISLLSYSEASHTYPQLLALGGRDSSTRRAGQKK